MKHASRHTLPALALMLLLAVLGFLPAAALADSYERALANFRDAGESSAFFENSYGYAIFPTIGKGGFVVGAAYGEGRVFEQGRYIGDTNMTQLSIGWQLGGQAYSQIIFFQDERALREFTSGSFEFRGQASAVVITAGVQAGAGTSGSSAGASGGERNAATVGSYYRGMAVFQIARGGLMYEATVAGQRFNFIPR